ncbi:hypothetical protein ACFPM3_00475 [Streptomyces coeruleoprunus]|uniref:Secreted protein n=1 Tax=Streptomyces coeruleoprunus TaxID=285563 RepID=A0ABV9X533_9ACTN
MAAAAHLLLTALSKQVLDVPARAGSPLTSEPPLAGAAPLTSEPPLTDATPLTSEPTATGAAGGPET